MPLDDLLSSMHRDKLALHETSIKDIDEKIARRQDAGNRLIDKLEEQLRDLGTQRLQLIPEGGMSDLHRRERQGLEREIRDREITLEMERLQLTRDLSFLEGERRRLTQYVMEEEQLQSTVTKAFYDPKP